MNDALRIRREHGGRAGRFTPLPSLSEKNVTHRPKRPSSTAVTLPVFATKAFNWSSVVLFGKLPNQAMDLNDFCMKQLVGW